MLRHVDLEENCATTVACRARCLCAVVGSGASARSQLMNEALRAIARQLRRPRDGLRERLLAGIAIRSDGGCWIGRRPEEVPPEILARKFRAQNPLKALRDRCLDCCCGNGSEVRKCTAIDCPSWPFRMGTNPFRQKRTLSAEQTAEMVERLAQARSNNRRLTRPDKAPDAASLTHRDDPTRRL